MLLLLWVFTISGAVLAGISVPLILKKVGPNPWYGFRVPATLGDPEVWYPVNAYSARRLFLVGISGALSAVVLYFIPDIDVSTYALACAGVTIGGLIVALIQSFRFLGQQNLQSPNGTRDSHRGL